MLRAPAGRWTFPTLSLQSFPCCLDPYPGVFHGALTRFFPWNFGHPPVITRLAPYKTPHNDFSADLFSRLQSFSNVQAPGFARHPDRSYRCILTHTQGSCDFYFRAEHELLPSRASDMLTVRTGQLTVWGLSPHKIRSLVGCSPNGKDFERSHDLASLQGIQSSDFVLICWY